MDVAWKVWSEREDVRALIDLHEMTEYKVRGKEGMSSDWVPVRGLREGCSTSPILFNIYHQAVLRQAGEARAAAWASEVGGGRMEMFTWEFVCGDRDMGEEWEWSERGTVPGVVICGWYDDCGYERGNGWGSECNEGSDGEVWGEE